MPYKDPEKGRYVELDITSPSRPFVRQPRSGPDRDHGALRAPGAGFGAGGRGASRRKYRGGHPELKPQIGGRSFSSSPGLMPPLALDRITLSKITSYCKSGVWPS